jgi:hypothetical protein
VPANLLPSVSAGCLFFLRRKNKQGWGEPARPIHRVHFSNAHQRVKPPPPLIENAGAGGKQTAGFMAQADITGCVRRDNIIIQGIKEVEGETVDKLKATVVELCHSIGVKVEKAAIGDIHRLGKRQGERNKARPVLVKSNRLVKCAVMQNKRRLRDMEMSRERWEEKITVYEDLTEARRKLREAARDAPDVSFCYSRDGTIMCKTNDGRWVDVNNYNDLLKVGVQGENLEPARYYKGLL